MEIAPDNFDAQNNVIDKEGDALMREGFSVNKALNHYEQEPPEGASVEQLTLGERMDRGLPLSGEDYDTISEE